MEYDNCYSLTRLWISMYNSESLPDSESDDILITSDRGWLIIELLLSLSEDSNNIGNDMVEV